jgi:LysR family transcriptional activator of glutamate synthase operon
MELLQLRYFRTAAQLENFTKTAEHYMIPQSAVSTTIRKLEKELGCDLFNRHGKKIILNDNGKLFLKKVDIALTNIDDAVDELKYSELKTIGIYIQSGIHFILDLVSAFERAYSNSKIVYYQGESVVCHEGDFTFFQLPIDETIYNYRILMEDEIVLAAPHNSKWAQKKEIDLADLHNEKFISYDTKNQLRIFTEHICEEHGFHPNIIFEANAVSSLRSMVEANMGLSLVPYISWMLNVTRHVHLIPFTTHPKRHLVVAWKKTLPLSPDKQLFLDFAIHWFTQFQNKSILPPQTKGNPSIG